MTDKISHQFVTTIIRRLSQQPAFRIYGKANYETRWHIIDVFATDRRNTDSRWPFWRGHCITLSANLIAVGWDFAVELVGEQTHRPSSQSEPTEVLRGHKLSRTEQNGFELPATSILAHECGHTAQARRMGWLFWLVGATFTLFREGPHWWNRFENEASETGQFGGIVPGTLHPRLRKL